MCCVGDVADIVLVVVDEHIGRDGVVRDEFCGDTVPVLVFGFAGDGGGIEFYGVE